MKRKSIRYMPASLIASLAVCCMVPTFAQSAIPAGKFNAWLQEQPAPQAPLYRVRMAGVASYKTYRSNATLAFSCRGDAPHVSAELTFDPKTLGFDIDPYEGPDATASGPITLTSGSDAAVRIKVGGWFGDGGPFDTGTPFLFGFQLDSAQVKRWTADSTHGQSLHIEVPSAKGGAPLTMTFRWPDDDAVFKQAMMPCLRRSFSS